MTNAPETFTFDPSQHGPKRPKPNRAQRRAHKSKGRKVKADKASRNEMMYVDTIDEEMVMFNQHGHPRGPVGHPLSFEQHELPSNLADEPIVSNVLTKYPTPSMLLSKAMVSKLKSDWTHLPEIGVYARLEAWRDVVVISHSEGALEYAIHPLVWIEDGRVKEERGFWMAVLTGQLGPDRRAPSEVSMS